MGKDSRVYIWNYNQPHLQSSKAKRSARSCEYFFLEGVSVALPWSSIKTTMNKDASPETEDHHSDSCSCVIRDPERFSLPSWFSMDVSCKGSAVTWPEEKLPFCELPSIQDADCRNYSATWGLVIVTAGCDGMIRTFHNYGFPTKI